MNREAIEKLADTLEFEDIPQAHGSLINYYDPSDVASSGPSLCALGVACKVYAEVHNMPLGAVVQLERTLSGYLPTKVAKWYGLEVLDQRIIVDMNDVDEVSLHGIGSWIRDNWVKEQ